MYGDNLRRLCFRVTMMLCVPVQVAEESGIGKISGIALNVMLAICVSIVHFIGTYRKIRVGRQIAEPTPMSTSAEGCLFLSTATNVAQMLRSTMPTPRRRF